MSDIQSVDEIVIDMIHDLAKSYKGGDVFYDFKPFQAALTRREEQRNLQARIEENTAIYQYILLIEDEEGIYNEELKKYVVEQITKLKDELKTLDGLEG